MRGWWPPFPSLPCPFNLACLLKLNPERNFLGTWKNPPPGTPTHGKQPDKDHELGQKISDLDDPIARSNFRVVVIKPDEVERLDLADPATARRWKFTFVVEKEQNGAVADGEAQEKGEWKVEELWP